uniref:Uncharacterized protein n=1 Tax=Plectus sambesii TaxID=2011161 RepID=A0A914WP58_9BILA
MQSQYKVYFLAFLLITLLIVSASSAPVDAEDGGAEVNSRVRRQWWGAYPNTGYGYQPMGWGNGYNGVVLGRRWGSKSDSHPWD